MTLTVAMHIVALLAYLAASVIYGANLSIRHHGHARAGRIVLGAGVAVHFAAIGSVCLRTHLSPVATTFGSLSTTAWAIALICLIVEARGWVPVMGTFAAPLSCAMVFGAMLRTSSVLRMSPEVHSRVISVHVLLVLLSIAAFAVAACCAIFYLWQYSVLRRRPHGASLFRLLPPLEVLDTVSFRLVAFGLPLLTLGLGLGIERAANGGLPGAWAGDPHTIVSYVLWLIYSGYLAGRTTAGLRGTRAAYVLLFGMLVSFALFVLPATAHRFR